MLCKGNTIAIIFCMLNLIFLSQKSRSKKEKLKITTSRNMIGQFMKTFLNRPVKILQFLTRGDFQ